MFAAIREFLERRRVRKLGLTAAQWESAVADWPVAARYQGAERDALRELTFRFIARKDFVSGGNFALSDAMCLKVATMACVPILHLDLDWYDNWYSVILYEDDFMPADEHMTDDGVVHDEAPVLSGEAWLRGPVILSWGAIQEAGPHASEGRAHNVVIHEMAHKLDMLRDGANGAPPLHPDMRRGEWHEIFTAAWERLHDDQGAHRDLPVDDYALTSPAEFFAVCSETFFEDPQRLKDDMPEVYRLLCQFYRQQPVPLARPGM